MIYIKHTISKNLQIILQRSIKKRDIVPIKYNNLKTGDYIIFEFQDPTLQGYVQSSIEHGILVGTQIQYIVYGVIFCKKEWIGRRFIV
jgi:hypothetical protein